jgi:hypothetical protein
LEKHESVVEAPRLRFLVVCGGHDIFKSEAFNPGQSAKYFVQVGELTFF